MKTETHEAGVLKYQKNSQSHAFFFDSASRLAIPSWGSRRPSPGRGVGSWRPSTRKKSQRR